MNESVLERLTQINQDMEIWWDSSPLVFDSWVKSMVAAVPDAEKDLFCKIVSGDKSDGIPSVFKKCGIKTAEKYWNDKENFNKKLESDLDAVEQYELNKMIIDFNNIPPALVLGFKKKYGLSD